MQVEHDKPSELQNVPASLKGHNKRCTKKHASQQKARLMCIIKQEITLQGSQWRYMMLESELHDKIVNLKSALLSTKGNKYDVHSDRL